MRLIIFSVFLFTGALSAPLSAQWYQAQGSATVLNSEKEAARTEAIKNALKKTLLVAGASLNSVQQVVNGLLTQDELSIRASGTLNSVELIDETYENGVIKVTIRADIFPQEKQCFAADFQKSMLVTRAHLAHREQANIGQIYDIDQQLAIKLAEKIKKNSQYIDVKLAYKNKTPFSRYNQSFDREKIKALTMELGRRFDTQFILYSEITDVSFGTGVLNNWQFWQEDQYERNFKTDLYIYSAINGELLVEMQYANLAPWISGKRETADFNGQSFWQSPYGQMIDSTLEKAIIDIDDNMMCKQTRAKIVKVDGNEIVVNVGKRQGVQIGDEFSLLHMNNFTTDDGKTYSGFNLSSYQVSVTEVFQDSAVAKSTDAGLLGNIQISDLAVKN
ncbi:flagellar assembly protein T N-terminal domain-containing protein [Colwellia sp. MEBiC06753]